MSHRCCIAAAACVALLAFCALGVAQRVTAQGGPPIAPPAQTPSTATTTQTTTPAQSQPGDVPATGAQQAAVESSDETAGSGSSEDLRQENRASSRAVTFLEFAAVVVGFVAVIAFLAGALFLVARFAQTLATERIGIESSWGGFGGASSGWNLSRPLSLLVAIALLGSFAYMSLDAVLRTVDDRADVNPPADATDKADESAESQAR